MKRGVVIAIVAVLVVGGVGVGIWALTRHTSQADRRLGDERDYFCGKCSKKYTLARYDDSAWVLDEETIAADAPASHRPHCPLCKARHSGWLIFSCPKCGKSFIAAAAGQPAAPLPNGMVMAESGNICPYCKADITGKSRP